MKKRTRFILVLAVLAACFWFLWPSISWYVRTPKDQQSLALGSLEKIKDYTTLKAKEEVDALISLAKENPDSVLDDSYGYLVKAAKKNYKEAAKVYKSAGQEAPAVPSVMTVSAVLNSFSMSYDPSGAIQSVIEGKYRDEILKAKKRYNSSVKLGLDLSGGMNIIVRADLDAALKAQNPDEVTDEAQFKKDAMAQAIETLTGRIDKFGLTSPVIRQQGEDRIYIEIPGAADSESVNTIIMGKGILNFRLVDEDATAAFNSYYAANAANAFTADGKLRDPSVIPEDCEVMGLYQKDDYGLDERIAYLAVKKAVALDGKHVTKALVTADQTTNQPEVNFVLDSEGADIFATFTAANVGKRLAIVSDDKIKSAATIRQAINGGSVSLSGGFSVEEAQNIQKILQTAWLEVPLEVESQQVVGASLGDQAIHQGMMALAVGLLLVLGFMLMFYLGAGVNAVVAQILNMYIMFSVLSAFNLTLTLSSIAGMILTVGMSVDANVIIFERIKEELRAGKSRAAAIVSGFDNAFWAIMDSNITTFIAAAFLTQLGTGSIQGFAVSLSIGVCSSVFTALIVSRLMFDFQTDVVGKKNMSISWRVK
ncbi:MULTISPECIES: protein translocase subunit SecD [Treponema]|jgi:preprotein translocase subunit SecD|uniref:Protein translocase subunit SecD n=1 Tax=Treponema saccharophilum DSM 2985 TaxID=907348 RepID=H7EH92_9SPIR|nr:MULTISPECIES: protein translocase subunit SecD [Treponema]EIC03012.1 protein-export membrane protein SecD [Treponema saccharophilum DSM 2985]MBQ5536435.1 protein translocase subunit SecD [Treponema sp.]BDC96370.1 protein translocase subunit SecD [Treponema saccharophilum]